MFSDFGINAGYVEEMHAKYLVSPQAVDEKWRAFFAAQGVSAEGARGTAGPPSSEPAPASVRIPRAQTNGRPLDLRHELPQGDTVPPPDAFTVPPPDALDEAGAGGRVYALINAYRVRGHLYARLDPLGNDPLPQYDELDPKNFGLGEADMDKLLPTINVKGLPERAKLRDIIAHMRQTYCSSIGVEFTQMESLEQRLWLRGRMEETRNRLDFTNEKALRTLAKLTDAEMFEQFLAKNFVGEKRFSAEGGESMIAMLDVIIEECGAQGVAEVVFGMAHRGRLNVLVNTLGKKVREIFAAFDDKHPDRFIGGGDVKYHLGYSSDVATASGANVHLTLCFNPSHLEWVNPVVEGRTRAKRDRNPQKDVVPLLIHGDAAMMGQGIVSETLNMAGIEGYQVGGTIHIVVNNQIGFTTLPRDSRSTRYCTDITRMMRLPVFHVNGEDPEAVISVAKLAVEFRQRFHKDVVIDMYCYRKHGHNEGDEPRFTQPRMYAAIERKPGVRAAYVEKLVSDGHVTQEQADEIAHARKAALDAELAEARAGDYLALPNAMQGLWAKYRGGLDQAVPEIETGVAETELLSTLTRLAEIPQNFDVHAKVRKAIVSDRFEAVRDGKPLDWGTAEHLAFATLLKDRVPVRLAGQDVMRGTFTHRHAVLFDQKTEATYVPLRHLAPDQARFDIINSPLSEAGVLGFEWGYSLDYPDALVLWEAQFGDFLNTAQVIVDQFISSAEDKWLRLSGLVLLLPHGFEGQGPEHSSARLERFMQLAAEDNMQICNLTTPAQFFHVLRRQVHRPWRKPLVIMTPKSLLRHKECVSPLADLAKGGFRRVIADDTIDPKRASRVLMCSGKVYYDLLDARRKRERDDVAIVRLEQLYPLSDALRDALAPYESGTSLVWVQEEPRNMGAWYFLNARLRETIGERLPLSVIARAESASPATGSRAAHALEQKMLMDAAFS